MIKTTTLSNSLSTLLESATYYASKSQMDFKHGAVLFGHGKKIYYGACNSNGNKLYGFDIPSQHAEANCLRLLNNRAHCGRTKNRREKYQCVLRGFKEV